MDCPAVNTLEEAQRIIPSSIIPIHGLRRDHNGFLTRDARNTIIDSLKSRGMDCTDHDTKAKILKDLENLLCFLNNQYQFLLGELYRRSQAGEDIPAEFVDMIRLKNIYMLDVLTISRHIRGMASYNGTVPFIEGWQNSPSSLMRDVDPFSQQLVSDRGMLDSKSFEELKRHSVEITTEKNKMASNYVAFYGFLNLVAVGLIIYISSSK